MSHYKHLNAVCRMVIVRPNQQRVIPSDRVGAYFSHLMNVLIIATIPNHVADTQSSQLYYCPCKLLSKRPSSDLPTDLEQAQFRQVVVMTNGLIKPECHNFDTNFSKNLDTRACVRTSSSTKERSYIPTYPRSFKSLLTARNQVSRASLSVPAIHDDDDDHFRR